MANKRKARANNAKFYFIYFFNNWFDKYYCTWKNFGCYWFKTIFKKTIKLKPV